MESMQVIWLENRVLRYRIDVPVPSPNPGEALIKVRLAGICATDLELVRGYYPFAGIPGHEFVGEVVSAPGDASLVGKRVVGEINASCGECEQCQAGRSTHCERRTVLGIKSRDGAFADFLTLPLVNLHTVPDSVPDEAAVFTEPLAAALEIQEQVEVRPSDRVLVIGAGRLGQLVVQTLVLTGCDLSVVVRRSLQRELVEAFGVATLELKDISGMSWDIVIEVTGSEAGFHLARQLVRPRGTIVLKSTYKGDVTVNFSSLVVDEVSLVGSRCGPFAPALRLLESGLVDPRPLIRERFSLKEGLTAFERASQPGVLKVLLQP